jgi:predicted Rossmann fold flavoprotein
MFQLVFRKKSNRKGWISMIFDLAIVGGGPAGMMAAGTAAARSKSVILLDMNPKLGKKLFLTGKGRCNITNRASVEQVIENTIVNGKFLRNSLHKFTPLDVINFFENNGLKTLTERGNRIFPASGKSSDVIKVLIKFLNQNQVSIKQDKVKKLEKREENFHLYLENEIIKAHKVLLATGGRSYPVTGSDGSGYRLAAELGHSITPQKPSLVPLLIDPVWKSSIGRLHLKNVSIRIIKENKQIYKDFGEMEISDTRLSGPLALTVSSLFRKLDGLQLVIDLKPALTEQQLDFRLIRELEKNPSESLEKMLKRIIPIKLREVILETSGLSGEENCSTLNKTQRRKLLYSIKNLSIRLQDFADFQEAIITSGGVSVKEIDPLTMQSKLVEGLYFAGEIIDVDALTGGYNLQIAWSTGYTAGISC